METEIVYLHVDNLKQKFRCEFENTFAWDVGITGVWMNDGKIDILEMLSDGFIDQLVEAIENARATQYKD